MRVTIALPAYDEVGNLAAAVSEGLIALSDAQAEEGSEVLVVDDGSRDGTSALADELGRTHAKVRVIHHESNRGFSGAMTTCFRESRGEWVFLGPADGQSRLGDLERFMQLAAGADIVVGVRASRQAHAGRKVLSRGFHFLARSLFALPQREFSATFLFRRALLDAMPFRSRPRSASILPEILYRARARGARIAELEVLDFARRGGRPKGGQPSVVLVTLFELLRVAVLVRFDEMRKVRRAPAA